MSGGIKCKCPESKKPLKERNWKVHQLKCNFSYFAYPKGGMKPSIYSGVQCESCGASWRTKSDYVFKLQEV